MSDPTMRYQRTWIGGRIRHPDVWFPPAIIWALVFCCGVVVHLSDVHWAWLTITFLVLPPAAVGSVGGERFGDAARGFMFLTGLEISGWLTLAAYARDDAETILDGPLSGWTLGAWALCAAVTIPAWVGVRYASIAYEHQRARRIAAGPLAIEGPKNTERVRWEEALDAAGLKGVQWIERRAERHGMVVRVRSVSYDEAGIAGRLGSLEAALHFTVGSLQVEQVVDRDGRQLAGLYDIIHDPSDVLAGILEPPRGWWSWIRSLKPISCLDAFPVGEFPDGETLCLSLAEIHAMIVGMTGSGKSNLLHLIIARLSRCYNAVIWMLDFKGGATGATWVRPWLRRATDPSTGRPLHRPCIDWLAIDRFEGERIIRGAQLLVKLRPRLRNAEGGPGGNRHRPTAADPAVFLICDEVGEALAQWSSSGTNMLGEGGLTQHQMTAAATSLAVTGRAEGVYLILAGQRGTVDMFGSGTLMSQLGLKIAFGTSDPQEAAAIFKSRDVAARKLTRLTVRGAILVETIFGSRARSRPGKAYFLGDDEQLVSAVETCVMHNTRHTGAIEPVWDGGTRHERPNPVWHALNKEVEYGDRWADPERMGWLLAVGGTDTTTWQGRPLHPVEDPMDKMRAGPPPARPPSPAPAPVQRTPGSPPDDEGGQEGGFWRPPAGLTPPRAGTVTAPPADATPPPPPVPPADPRPAGHPEVTPAGNPDTNVAFDALTARLGPLSDADDGDGDGPVRMPRAEKINVLVQIVNDAGPAGIRAGQLIAELARRGIISGQATGRGQFYRLRDVARADGRITQPAGGETPYFTPRYDPTRSTAA